MKSRDDHVEEGATALRELMANPSDGRATRARVLADVARRDHHHQRLRRLATLLSVPLLILGSASAAFTLGAWHAPVGRAVIVKKTAAAPVRPALPALPTPDARPSAKRVDQPVVDEAIDYGRAHRAHFVADSPAWALRAWDEYLRRYPHGTFVPEARFNRALCLIRLGENGRAVEALRPFALGRFEGYRQQEARSLLERLTGKQDWPTGPRSTP
jgi:hypothetical protein